MSMDSETGTHLELEPMKGLVQQEVAWAWHTNLRHSAHDNGCFL